MTKHFNYSKGLHVLTFFCFLLPFFNTSCEQESKKTTDQTDSVEVIDSVATKVDTTNTIQENSAIIKDTSSSEEKEKLLSIKISEGVPFLKLIFNPSKNIYSGLGTVIDSFPLIMFFMTPISFLLLLISLTTKLIDKKARRIIVVIDILAFGCLFIAQSLSWDCQRLWGFWTTIIFVGILTIYDFYISRLFHIQDNKESK